MTQRDPEETYSKGSASGLRVRDGGDGRRILHKNLTIDASEVNK